MFTWWRHQMETFSALLAICAGNSPVPGEFPAQRPVTRSFHVFFDLRLNKSLSKQTWGWWFETLSRRLWGHCNVWYMYSRLWYLGPIIVFCDHCFHQWPLRKLPRATTNVQKKKSYVGLFISYVGLFISYVGLIKSYVGLWNSYVGLFISYVGDKISLLALLCPTQDFLKKSYVRLFKLLRRTFQSPN